MDLGFDFDKKCENSKFAAVFVFCNNRPSDPCLGQYESWQETGNYQIMMHFLSKKLWS